MRKLIGLTSLLTILLALAIAAVSGVGARFSPSMLNGRQLSWVIPPQTLLLSRTHPIALPIAANLPKPPLTLELVWRLSVYQPAVATWQLLNSYISITGYVWRAAPSRDPQMDALLPLGQFNRAVIEFMADGQTRFWLNDRLIWQKSIGANISGPLTGNWELVAFCTCPMPAAFTWKRIALYTP